MPEASIQIRDRGFQLFLSATQIQEIVQKLADQINTDYNGKDPLFLAILNGSFMFAADLFKYLSIPCSISFVKLASYKGTTSTGNVISLIGLDEKLHKRNVIVLEDIVDTGKTLSQLIPDLREQQPESLKIATLLLKPDALKYPIRIDYAGIEIPDKFIVGYGLDYDGHGRNLSDIYQVNE